MFGFAGGGRSLGGQVAETGGAARAGLNAAAEQGLTALLQAASGRMVVLRLAGGGLMAVPTETSRPAARVTERGSGGGSTRVVVAVLGTVVGLAGVEHGVGEMLQGPVRPEGPFIASWPDAPALEILSGEPAVTVVPNVLVTGVLAVAVGLAVVVWSIWFAARHSGGQVLIGLSGLLLLVGGGVAPPLMGFILGAVATRMTRVPRQLPGRWGRIVAPAWAWFLAAAVLGYVGLMPGMALASIRGVASAALVIGVAAFAFATSRWRWWRPAPMTGSRPRPEPRPRARYSRPGTAG